MMSVWQLETSTGRQKAYELRYRAKAAIFEKGLNVQELNA